MKGGKAPMNVSQKQNQKGFTIIEVVLVLAIAGLIFLMVFIALPALQRSQRDSQRKNDISRIKTAVTSYQSSNRGSVPKDATTVAGFQTTYLQPGTEYVDPRGTPYTLAYKADADSTPPELGVINYGSGVSCGTDGAFASSSNSRDYALQIQLEGQKVPYCIDSK
jgi:prepilin-type N-terminal cleavage/methylation domain-containing protein